MFTYARNVLGSALSHSRTRLRAGGGGAMLRLVDTVDVASMESAHVDALHRRLWSCSFSPDGQFLATCGEHPSILIWSVSDEGGGPEPPPRRRQLRVEAGLRGEYTR